MTRVIYLLLLAVVASAPALAIPVATKQVAAPPADIASGLVQPSDPIETGISSRSAMVPIEAIREDDTWVWTHRFVVAQDNDLVIVPIVAGSESWSLRLDSPDGSSRTIHAPGTNQASDARLPAGTRSFTGSLGPLGGERAGVRVEIQRPLAGAWTATLRSTDAAPAGALLIAPGTSHDLYTHRSSNSALVGAPVALRSSFTDAGRLSGIRAVVRSPGDLETQVAGDPADGSVQFTPTEPGTHAVRVIVTRVDGTVLTTQHAIRVDRPVQTARSAASTASDGAIQISLGQVGRDRRVIAAAEVWGRDATGLVVPVTWLARVCQHEATLTLDLAWLAFAGVAADTLELRNARIHDADSAGTLWTAERLALPVKGEVVLPVAPVSPTDTMLMGDRNATRINAPIAPSPNRAIGAGHRLLLVHGYCSGGNPFTTSHFTGDVGIFSDINQNRSQDAFALQILSQTAPAKSFGVAGHSQGGLAALHLYTFYFSGLEWAEGDRLIQSVGAPYQGTPLAGNAAALGDIFGAGCGPNSDLDPTGAAQWLSLIPSWARDDVFYWTTAFEDRPFAFDFCNIVSDLFLSDPDDGVIERTRGQLPGGNNMGHLEGQCHTDGMRDPPQCRDFSRNSEINLRAKR